MIKAWSISDTNLVGRDMSDRNEAPKFTRGEKCLFTHLVLTFVAILVVVIFYLIHLYVVDHAIDNVFATRRFMSKSGVTSKVAIGLAYVTTTPSTATCNTLLLRREWSVAPAHCVTIRTDPDLASLVHSWFIKYADQVDSSIKRSIPHPHFERDTLANNIGLFQHSSITADKFIFPTFTASQNFEHMVIGSWQRKSQNGDESDIKFHPVRVIASQLCGTYTFQIEELRPYEYCVVFSNKINVDLEYGALIGSGAQVLGILSWGESNAKALPFVILNTSYFQDWLLDIAQLR